MVCALITSSKDYADLIDAPDFTGSDLWSDNTTSGLGRPIGVSSNDFVLNTGGFSSDFNLAYPAPHSLRRNYTLQPWLSDADLPQYFTEPAKLANTSFTAEAIDALISGYVGDYKGFQANMEGFEGPHGAVHEILGGCVSLIFYL